MGEKNSRRGREGGGVSPIVRMMPAACCTTCHHHPPATSHPHPTCTQPHLHRLLQDADTEVQFWKVLLCDPEGSWTPGRKERGMIAAGQPTPRSGPKLAELTKKRNLIVR